jgi:hypothetical protein
VVRRGLAGAAVLGLLYIVSGFRLASPGSWQPSGYKPVGSQVAYRWTTDSCAAAAAEGCWHALFVAHDGCSSQLAVTLDESRGGIVVGDVFDEISLVPPLEPVELEFDATAGAPLTGSIASATCSQLGLRNS